MKSFMNTPNDAHCEIRELLAMAVNAVIAEFLDVEIARVRPDVELTADLGMSALEKKRLQRELAFVFDTTQIDIIESMTVRELVNQVADVELPRLAIDRREQTVFN
jgi:hypothetical protein